MRKTPTQSLVLLMLISFVLSGCAGIKREPKSITIAVPTLSMPNPANPAIIEAEDFFKLAASQFMEDRVDEPVEVNVVSYPIEHEKNFVEDSFGSDDQPDLLFGNFLTMAAYIFEGHLRPVDDLLEDEVFTIVDRHRMNQGMLKGQTYMVPFFALQNLFVYNKDIFHAAGLGEFVGDEKTIQSWSLEEWDTILSVLKDNMAEPSYPISMYAKNDQGDTHIMALLFSHGCQVINDEGYFELSNPEGIAALRWISENYDKEYYPHYCENMELSDMSTLFAKGQLAISIGNQALAKKFEDMNTGYVNFPSADGNGFTTSFITGFGIVDSDNEEAIELSKEFIKYIYSSEDLLDLSSAGIPANKDTIERYRDEVYMLDQFASNAYTNVDIKFNIPNWSGVRSVFHKCIQDLLRKKTTPEEAAAQIDEFCNKQIHVGWERSRISEKLLHPDESAGQNRGQQA